MGVGGGAGRAAGVAAAGVGCDPCKRVEKKSWACWSSIREGDAATAAADPGTAAAATAAAGPSARGFSKYFGYYLGCTDYWKHYGDLGDDGEIAVELHQGGQGLGRQQ